MSRNLMRRMLRGLKWSLGILVFVPTVHAAPSTYFVSFSGPGYELPVLGVFTYDTVNAGFSNFFVVWDGTLFDLTSAANAPLVDPGCPNEPSSAATSFALLNHSLACPGTVYNWAGEGAQFALGEKQFEFFAGGPNRAIRIQHRVPADDPFGSALGFGDWTLLGSLPGTFNYAINFTGPGYELPVLGVFRYDSTQLAFSNFFVVWDGTLFDLTSAANAPLVDPGCPNEPSSAATSFALLNHSLACPGTVYNWAGEGPQFALGEKQFEFFAGGPNRAIRIPQRVPADDPFGSALGFGDWTLSAVSNGPGGNPNHGLPEPATFVLLCVGLAGMALAKRSARTR